MRRAQEVAILADLITRLRAKESWAGEMHVQKCVYFLQEVLNVPLGYDFVLYKYGPYSFDLHKELNSMRADNQIALEAQPFPYGPKMLVTEDGSDLMKRFPRTRRQFSNQLEFITNRLADKTAGELEELATGLMVLTEHPKEIDTKLSERLRDLKPHVRPETAENRIREVRTLVAEAESLRALS